MAESIRMIANNSFKVSLSSKNKMPNSEEVIILPEVEEKVTNGIWTRLNAIKLRVREKLTIMA